jgi:hypothetical protein
MKEQFSKDDVLGFECKHVIYCEPPEPGMPDLHVVKRIAHLKDDRKVPELHFVRDFKRQFYVTQQAHRKHEQKKESELLENLNVFKSRQCDLISNIAKALGTPYFRGSLKKLCKSPYVYGADILSTAVLKQQYQKAFPDLNTPYVAAPFDIETDVVHGTNEPIIASTAYKNKVYTSVTKSFVERQVNVIPRLRQIIEEQLGEVMKKRGIEWIIDIVDDTVAVIKGNFNFIHEHQPDFLSIWNMNFDIPRVAETLKKHGVDPADVFSDPAVPKEYRHFHYKEGPSQKVTNSGLVTPIKPAGRWHTVFTPASYYVIDAMCSYRHIRNQFGEEQSYALDYILKKELDNKDGSTPRGKLKFTGITSVTEGTLEWHQEMQSKYPLEYIVYNVYDVVGMQLLDEKIQDLELTLPMFSGCSDFQYFRSQPRRMVDDLHFFYLENGRVFATTSDDMISELDELTVDTDGWIITLPAHLVLDNGMKVIKHAPWLRTNIRGHTGDLDVSAAYPTNEEVLNISQETTRRELVSIEGVSEYHQKVCGINLSGGQTNALEFCTTIFGMPTLDVLLESFEKHIAQTA